MALASAAYTGHDPVVQALLTALGVDINAQDNFGFTYRA